MLYLFTSIHVFVHHSCVEHEEELGLGFKASFVSSLADTSGHGRSATAHGDTFVSHRGVSFDGEGDFLTAHI